MCLTVQPQDTNFKRPQVHKTKEKWNKHFLATTSRDRVQEVEITITVFSLALNGVLSLIMLLCSNWSEEHAVIGRSFCSRHHGNLLLCAPKQRHFDPACYGCSYLSFSSLFYAVLIRKHPPPFILFYVIEPLVLNILHKEKVFDKQM